MAEPYRVERRNVRGFVDLDIFFEKRVDSAGMERYYLRPRVSGLPTTEDHGRPSYSFEGDLCREIERLSGLLAKERERCAGVVDAWAARREATVAEGENDAFARDVRADVAMLRNLAGAIRKG